MTTTERPKHRNVAKVRVRRFLGTATALTSIAVVGATSTGALDRFSDSAADPATRAAASHNRSAVPEAQTKVDVKQVVQQIQRRAAEPMPDLSKMNLPQLQTYATKMQAEFVQASLGYEEATTQAEQAQVAASQTQARAQVAAQEKDQIRSEVVSFVTNNYTSGALSSPAMQVLAAGPDSAGVLLSKMSGAEQVTAIEARKFDQMKAAEDKAEALAKQAALLQAQAVTARHDAHVLLADVQGRAAKVASAASEAVATSTSDQTQFASAEQDARNKAALENWRVYLNQLSSAHVVPPAAAALRNPKKLPLGLDPLAGADGTALPGVAAKQVHHHKTITVLPQETIAAVSRAFAAVGKPYVSGNNGPDTYDCAGLTSAVFSSPSYALTAASPVGQYQQTRLVPVRDAQVGDLVFFKDANGIQQVGVNLGGRLMVTADASAKQVGVEQYPSDPFAAGRVTLPVGSANTPPATVADAPTRCGADPSALTGSSMAYPMQAGTYTIGASFGQAGSMWSSGFHTGQDFVAPIGATVMAAKAGTVTVSQSSWGGPNFVTIDHGNGLQTDYAHMSKVFVKTGDMVQAGQKIGEVGALGNVTGPHLHFEVIVGGVKVDPMLFLTGSGSGNAGWGGYSNGMIPDSEMCPLNNTTGHELRCDAAAAYNALAAAYQKDMGQPMCITDSYRSYAVQVKLYGEKPSLAAVPGTSNHGWALAVDLCGGINSWGTKQREWMLKNAARFGWYSPGWAQPGNGREEPWHWEFGHIS